MELVPLLRQLSPSMSLQASATRQGIFDAGPLVFDGSGDPRHAWETFVDEATARS